MSLRRLIVNPRCVMPEPDPNAKTYKVASLSSLKPGEGKLVYAGVKKLALFLHEGQLYCIQNTCPHAGGFLALGEVQGCFVKCPRHSWGFNFIDGSCPSHPRYEVSRYRVWAEGDDVMVELPEDNLW